MHGASINTGLASIVLDEKGDKTRVIPITGELAAALLVHAEPPRMPAGVHYRGTSTMSTWPPVRGILPLRTP